MYSGKVPNRCDRCDVGHLPFSQVSRCEPVAPIKFCVAYDPDSGECTLCQSSYVLVYRSNMCQFNSKYPNCLAIQNGKCIVCVYGYLVSPKGTCQQVALPNCLLHQPQKDKPPAGQELTAVALMQLPKTGQGTCRACNDGSLPYRNFDYCVPESRYNTLQNCTRYIESDQGAQCAHCNDTANVTIYGDCSFNPCQYGLQLVGLAEEGASLVRNETMRCHANRSFCDVWLPANENYTQLVCAQCKSAAYISSNLASNFNYTSVHGGGRTVDHFARVPALKCFDPIVNKLFNCRLHMEVVSSYGCIKCAELYTDNLKDYVLQNCTMVIPNCKASAFRGLTSPFALELNATLQSLDVFTSCYECSVGLPTLFLSNETGSF